MTTGADLKASFDNDWGFVSKLAGANPKRTIFVCILLGLLLGRFVLPLFW